MSAAQFKQVKTIYAEVSEIASDQRGAFLEKACRGNAALRAEVEALLTAADRAGEFLASTTRDSVSPAGAADQPGREALGTIIGSYKLLELIGEGGFGSVFMAEQERPIRRKVALKIIKLGMDTKQVIARFEAERQALAMMDHPNIAKVFEAGATETGRPYFVMELVRGVPITEYCDSEKLTTNQRVELFIQVCNAIQHAHQKGVIHRDIKPNNVLVTMHDDRAVPKIIDFGIAKATSQPLTEKTLFTEFRQFVGTPAYMSPEQAQMNELDIDTRSDIYSLGVLLYELLTGATPFDQKQLRAAAYDEIRRIIREVDPPRPSARISTLGASLSNVAAKRSTDPAKLLRGLKGELDWIVMKCLEKDRTRRYETVNALLKDSQRFLNNEVVEASPPSATYRLRRFARRYRRGLLIAGLVAALLTATTIASIAEAIRARRAEASARVAQQAAENEAAKSALVSTFLEDVFQGIRPSVAAGRDTTLLREVSEKALAQLDTGLANQPEVRAELYSTFGNVFFNLSDTARAAELQRKALALRRSISKGDNGPLALSLYRLANAVQTTPEAVPLAKESLAMRQRLFGDSAATADSLTLVGETLRRNYRPSEAEPYLRQGIEMRARLGEQGTQQYALNLHELGVVLWSEGKRNEGVALTRQCVDLTRSVMPGSLRYPLRELGEELQEVGELQDAHPAATEALDIANKSLPEGSGQTRDCMRVLDGIDSDMGDYADAENVARVRLAMSRKHPVADYYDLADCINSLATILFNDQKYTEAESLFRSTLDLSPTVSAPDGEYAASADRGLGALLSAEGKYDQAEPLLRRAVLIFRQITPFNDYEVACATTCLANSLSDQGKYSEANQLYSDARQAFAKSLPPANPGREWCVTCFAGSLLNQGNYVQSEPLFREALAAERDKQGGRTAQSRLTAQGLADLLVRTGRAAEATALLKEFGLSNPATQPATPRPLALRRFRAATSFCKTACPLLP